jgi:hypothetical protein
VFNAAIDGFEPSTPTTIPPGRGRSNSQLWLVNEQVDAAADVIELSMVKRME